MNRNKLNPPWVLNFFIMGLILLFAVSLRIHTFYLPHNETDGLIHLSLAIKLEKCGLKEYTLKGIKLFEGRDILAVSGSCSQDKGDLLSSLERRNIFYYTKEPLCNMPPAYSFLLMLSHKIFSPHQLYLTVKRNLGPYAIILKPKFFLQAQFYAVWLNFAFSLLFILVVFMLGKLLFNERIGLWASLLIITSPLDIMTSKNLRADEMTALFSALGVLLFWQGRRKNNLLLVILSGISVGIAALTKGNGLFMIAVIFLSSILIEFRHCLTKKNFFNILFSKYSLFFVLAAICVCGFWYAKIALVYGTPWYRPYQEGIEKVSWWFAMVFQRNRFEQLYYFIYLSPLFIFSYGELIRTLGKSIFTLISKKTPLFKAEMKWDIKNLSQESSVLQNGVWGFTEERIILLVWFVLFTTILISIGGKEERYMLPVYPAIAILSSLTIEDVRVRLNRFKGLKHLGDMVVILIFCLASIWSIRLGLTYVFKNYAIFPFHLS